MPETRNGAGIPAPFPFHVILSEAKEEGFAVRGMHYS